MNEKEKMLHGENYNAEDKELKKRPQACASGLL